MSHLRKKFQQTSGQRLYTSHHFPARFQNILARQAGAAGDHPMSKIMFQSCFRARPALHCTTQPPSPLSRARNKTMSEPTGIFCRRSLVSAAALPLHLPSKAEHLGQGGSPHRFSLPIRPCSPPRSRQSGIVFPVVVVAVDGGKPSCLGIEVREGQAR